MQLGYGKTIAAPFAVRPVEGAPVSTPVKWEELQPGLEPVKFNIKTVPARMQRLKRDPFLGAINDPQRLEDALANLEKLVRPVRR
jgi:bifunctional non-homologous end joining protein LigD